MAKTTSKTAGQRLTAAEKKATALALREAGLTFEQIAAQIGCSTSRAHQYIVEALEKLAEKTAASADALRQLELERLDRLTTAAWPKAKRGELTAIDRILRVMERRAKLLGLDAPAKLANTNSEGEDVQGGVFVVPAPAASIDDWLKQAQAFHDSKDKPAPE